MESGEENLKNNKVFEVLQRVGRSFMLPIAILPVAGLFLGIGSSFTNETMLKAYGLYGIMGPGTIIHGILTVMSAAVPSPTMIPPNTPILSVYIPSTIDVAPLRPRFCSKFTTACSIASILISPPA